MTFNKNNSNKWLIYLANYIKYFTYANFFTIKVYADYLPNDWKVATKRGSDEINAYKDVVTFCRRRDAGLEGIFTARIYRKYGLKETVHSNCRGDFNQCWSPITYKEVVSPIDITNVNYWYFTEGAWIKINITKEYSAAIIFNQIYVSYFFIAAVAITIFWSSLRLTMAKSTESAISSFFIYVLAFTLYLFYFSADYVAILLFMVYVGAVLIFFVFILFTTDPKWFFSQNDFSFFETKEVKTYNKKDYKTFFSFNIWINILGMLLFFVKGDFSCSQPVLFSTFITTVFNSKVTLEAPSIFIFGEQLFSDYWFTTILLAFQLLIVLVLTMYILNLINFKDGLHQKAKPSFWVNFFFFKRYKSK